MTTLRPPLAPPLPILRTEAQSQAALFFILADPTMNFTASDYVLQKRELAEEPRTLPLLVPDNNVFDERPTAVDGIGLKK